jgi:YD repeat-containing protein
VLQEKGTGHDPQNRVHYRIDPGNTVTYNYDPAGRMFNVTDDTGNYTFTYDNMNRLTQATTDYSFDNAGRVARPFAFFAKAGVVHCHKETAMSRR